MHARRSLRLLLIDDSSDDCFLTVAALAQQQIVEWKRVDTRAGLVAALAAEWDLVLVDWCMPGWGGAVALEVLSERRGFAPPVIVMSSALPTAPEVARAMRLGAVAFIEKADRAKLGEVIDQVLVTAGGSLLERTAAYLLAYPDLAATIVNMLPLATVAVSARDGSIRLANQEAARLTGYAMHELVDAVTEMLVAEGLQERHATLRRRYFDNPVDRPSGSRVLTLRRKGGEEIQVDVVLRPIMVREGLLVVAVLRPVA